jgi:hypothetical protein
METGVPVWPTSHFNHHSHQQTFLIMSNTSEPSQGVVEILKTFLSRFRDASKKHRKGIISEAAKASEPPNMTKPEVAKHKKVSNTYLFIYE